MRYLVPEHHDPGCGYYDEDHPVYYTYAKPTERSVRWCLANYRQIEINPASLGTLYDELRDTETEDYYSSVEIDLITGHVCESFGDPGWVEDPDWGHSRWVWALGLGELPDHGALDKDTWVSEAKQAIERFVRDLPEPSSDNLEWPEFGDDD